MSGWSFGGFYPQSMSTNTGTTSKCKACEKLREALEQIERSPFIKGYEAIAVAREALGIKPKGGGK